MGYFDLLPMSYLPFGIPPLIGLLGVFAPFNTRVWYFLNGCALSFVFAVFGVALGIGAADRGSLVGVVLALWGMPALAIFCAATIVIRANRRISEERLRELIADIDRPEGHGLCPACKRVIPLESTRCGHCDSVFGEEAEWKVIPLVRTMSPTDSSGQQGICPNCEAVIPMNSPACPHCSAEFGDRAAWKIAPIWLKDLRDRER